MQIEPSRISLVDDNQTMTTLLKTLLEMENYKVFVITNTSKKDVINEIYLQKPNILIMDIHLKDSNGLEILKSLKNEPELMEIKVILTSGENLEYEALEAGANYFLLKPFMPKNLLTTLQKLQQNKGAGLYD